jgi:hypothetical protein
VLQKATTQKKRSTRRRVEILAENRFDKGWLPDDDGFNNNLLNLPREKLSDGAVMMLVIGVMMDEFVNARTNGEHGGPLEHRCKKESDNSDAPGSIGIFPDYRLFFLFPAHAKF